MDEIKNEEVKINEPTQIKETYSKEEVDALINKKISDTFGELLKEINKPKPVEEKPKEKTLDDLLF